MFLTQFDGQKAFIEPADTTKKIEGMPKVCIGVFSHLILEEWIAMYPCTVITEIQSVVCNRTVYKMNVNGFEFAFFVPYLGAPGAAGSMEELHAKGIESFVYFGCCGVLRHDIADGHLIVPTAAIRDEGTSFHYLAPADEIVVQEKQVNIMEASMRKLGLPYVKGKTWTTDAFYRETPQKIEKAKSMGAICVEMECAALASVAQYRGFSFAQFFWSADNLDAPEWDSRGLSTKGKSVSEKCMLAAIEIAKQQR